PVILVTGIRDMVLGHVLDELERTGPDRLDLQVLALGETLGYDPGRTHAGKRSQEARIRVLQRDLDRHRVHDLDFLDRVEPAAPGGCGLWVDDSVDAVFDVFGSQGLAVVELHIRTEMEEVRLPAVADLPLLGERGYNSGLFIVAGEALV